MVKRKTFPKILSGLYVVGALALTLNITGISHIRSMKNLGDIDLGNYILEGKHYLTMPKHLNMYGGFDFERVKDVLVYDKDSINIIGISIIYSKNVNTEKDQSDLDKMEKDFFGQIQDKHFIVRNDSLIFEQDRNLRHHEGNKYLLKIEAEEGTLFAQPYAQFGIDVGHEAILQLPLKSLTKNSENLEDFIKRTAKAYDYFIKTDGLREDLIK